MGATVTCYPKLLYPIPINARLLTDKVQRLVDQHVGHLGIMVQHFRQKKDVNLLVRATFNRYPSANPKHSDGELVLGMPFIPSLLATSILHGLKRLKVGAGNAYPTYCHFQAAKKLKGYRTFSLKSTWMSKAFL